MKKLLLAVLALGALAGADTSKTDAKKELKKLQGTWKVLTMERGGRVRDADEALGMVIAGDEFRLTKGDEVMSRGKLKIDASKTPRQADLEIAEDHEDRNVGKKALAIYSLDGSFLKLCVNRPGKSERPRAFSSPAGSQIVLVTLKREKP